MRILCGNKEEYAFFGAYSGAHFFIWEVKLLLTTQAPIVAKQPITQKGHPSGVSFCITSYFLRLPWHGVGYSKSVF